ncbi:MAG TPA: hypothetical protein VE201_02745 [Nitrospirales bacterium]|nr:hypothetical protein [Nitrospirales bacterium]
MSTDHPSRHSSCCHALVLLVATGVVFFGTALVDPSRLWLLVVPMVFCVTAYGAGALVERAIGGLVAGGNHPPMVVLSARMGVGLACLSLVTFLSALSRVLWLAGLVVLPAIAYGFVCAIRASFQLRPRRGSVAAGVGGCLLGGTWLVAWLWATIPPTFYDELVYHLVIPQRVLAAGELLTLPWVLFTLMPHASDLLLAWGLVLGDDLGARAIQFAQWAMCFLAVWAIVEVMTWPRVAVWAPSFIACAFAASPMVWFLGTLSFAETGQAVGLLCSAVVIASVPAQRYSWLALGLVLGWVASSKLSGLYWVAAALVAARVAGWPLLELSRAAVIALLTMTPWWIRAFVHTGNPVYPMFYSLLDGRPWSEESQVRLLADLPYGMPGSLGWMGLLRLPLDLVLHPERFGSASDVGALAVLSACGLLALPVAARVAGLRWSTRQLGDAAAVFVLVAGAGWVMTTPTARFFAPAFLLGLAVLVGLCMQFHKAAQGLALVLLLTTGGAGAWQFITQHAAVFSSVNVALGREKGDAYLARVLDHFHAARFVRETLPLNVRLLFIGETRPYYFSRDAVAPHPIDAHPLSRWVHEETSVESLIRRLTAEGITHVVLNVHEFRRVRDKYGVLAFSGEAAPQDERRLRELPKALRLLYAANGVYVFEVPGR